MEKEKAHHGNYCLVVMTDDAVNYTEPVAVAYLQGERLENHLHAVKTA